MSLPKSEQIWESVYDENKVLRYVITSDKRREHYTLWKVVGSEYQSIGRGKSPLELRKRFNYEIKGEDHD